MHIPNISDYRDSALTLVDSMADLTCSWPFRSTGFKWSIQQSTVTELSFQLVSNLSEREMQISFFSLCYPDFCYKFQLLLLAIQISKMLQRFKFSIWSVWHWKRDHIPQTKWFDSHPNTLIYGVLQENTNFCNILQLYCNKLFFNYPVVFTL